MYIIIKINSPWDIVFEWIPYNQFDIIDEISKDDAATVCSAIWKDGPLKYNIDNYEYIRESGKKVVLKCVHDSQNITNEFLNEVRKFFMNLIYFFNIITYLFIIYRLK